MKIDKKILIIIGVFFVFLFGFWNLKSKNDTSPIQNERVVQEFKANLSIEDGMENPNFDIQQYIGKSALEATEIVLDGNVVKSGEGEKAFVTGINGKNANTKKKEFWEFIVNGKQAEVGAGSYKIQNGDNIVWKINTY